jgi:hypothetical protein
VARHGADEVAHPDSVELDGVVAGPERGLGALRRAGTVAGSAHLHHVVRCRRVLEHCSTHCSVWSETLVGLTESGHRRGCACGCSRGRARFLAHDGGTTTRPRGDGSATTRRREDEAAGRMGAAAAMANSRGSCCAESHRGHDWGTTSSVWGMVWRGGGLGNGLKGRRDLNENINGKCERCFVKRPGGASGWISIQHPSITVCTVARNPPMHQIRCH